jgi:hypothetical protein
LRSIATALRFTDNFAGIFCAFVFEYSLIPSLVDEIRIFQPKSVEYHLFFLQIDECKWPITLSVSWPYLTIVNVSAARVIAV